jgi:hypothetical protein
MFSDVSISGVVLLHQWQTDKEKFENTPASAEFNDFMHGKGVAPVLAETQCRFRRQVKYPDSLTVSLTVDDAFMTDEALRARRLVFSLLVVCQQFCHVWIPKIFFFFFFFFQLKPNPTQPNSKGRRVSCSTTSSFPRPAAVPLPQRAPRGLCCSISRLGARPPCPRSSSPLRAHLSTRAHEPGHAQHSWDAIKTNKQTKNATYAL